MGAGICICSETKADTADRSIDVSRLVVQSHARQFPLKATSAFARAKAAGAQRHLVSKPDIAGGECMLFLESAHIAPSCQMSVCSAVPSKPSGKPSVRAWASRREEGDVIGQVAEWPAKSNNTRPSWYSAQLLGIPLEERGNAILHIELRDDQTVLGSLSTPLGELPGHCTVSRELGQATDGCRPSSVSFQILDSREFMGARTVFFVRHGESVWNKAQESMQFGEMVRTTDHPLSTKGRHQAEDLRRRLTTAAKKADPAASKLLRANAVYVSPLTRAVQTAVIALGTMIENDEGLAEMVLMANAREKQNFGGLDSRPTEIGVGVLQKALDQLRLLYKDDEDAIVKTIAQLRFDVEEVQDIWWHEGAVESAAQVEARMDEFMLQLLYSQHRSVVVVGHSHFFRSVFKRFLSADLWAKQPELARNVTKLKLINCGVARLDLDPMKGLTGGPIVGLELVLDTTLDMDGGILACCAADERMKRVNSGHSRGELLFDHQAGANYAAATAADEEALGQGPRPLRPSPAAQEATAERGGL